ncbi:MAG: hypothetical protein R2867_39665 [Caldilineaceae bacterium]
MHYRWFLLPHTIRVLLVAALLVATLPLPMAPSALAQSAVPDATPGDDSGDPLFDNQLFLPLVQNKTHTTGNATDTPVLLTPRPYPIQHRHRQRNSATRPATTRWRKQTSAQ